MKIYEWVDPPSGWLYGFPKRVDEDYYSIGKNKTEWFVKQGYPIKLINEGMLNNVRHWYEEVKDDVPSS